MRKYFEGHSFIGVALIVSALSLGLFLRFYDLSTLSPWTDELASWWYLRHLDEVFFRESHSPLYYGLLRLLLGSDATITGIRTFTAAVSAIHLIEFFFLGQRVFSKKQFLVFWILICLSPVDIVYARMARHYSWLLEGVIVYLLLIRGEYPRWMRYLTATFMSFIHIFFIVPVGIMAIKSKQWKDLLPAIPALAYYLVRIIFHGHDKVRSNVSWNADSFLRFLELLIKQFMGDTYPHNVFNPVNIWAASFLVVATFSWILWKKKESGKDLMLVVLGSIIVIEILSLWLNLRVSRYVIYLISFWIIALADTAPEDNYRGAFSALVGSILIILAASPIHYYSWEAEKVAEWKDYSGGHQVSQHLVCSNIYQSDYYDLNADVSCREKLRKISQDEPLLFFDMNMNDNFILLAIMNKMKVQDYRLLKFGTIVYFTPKDKDAKSKK